MQVVDLLEAFPLASAVFIKNLGKYAGHLRDPMSHRTRTRISP